MRIKEIMTVDCRTVAPEAKLHEAAEEMKNIGVGFLPVLERNRIVGLLTDRDIVTRAVAEGMDPATSEVRMVMTPKVWTIREDRSVEEAAEMMREKKVRRLLVMNENDELAGILSLGDVAVHGSREAAGYALEAISEPARPKRSPGDEQIGRHAQL